MTTFTPASKLLRVTYTEESLAEDQALAQQLAAEFGPPPALTVITPAIIRSQAADLARQARNLQRIAARMEAEDEYKELVTQADNYCAMHDEDYQHAPQFARICELEDLLGY